MLIATITSQRSGSKLLGTIFNTGAVVRSCGELFFPGDDAAVSFTQYLRSRVSTNTLPTSAETALNEYFGRIEATLGVVHFDVMLNQLEIPCVGWNPYHDTFLYGYLKSRGSVVISLERAPIDCFMSQKYLQISGKAHNYSEDAANVYPEQLIDLDLLEFEQYRSFVIESRCTLYRSMSNYHGFIVIPYENIANTLTIPDYALETIVRVARISGITLDRKKIQLGRPAIYPSGVDYRRVFRNAAQLHESNGARD
jgi:hypothetical protein